MPDLPDIPDIPDIIVLGDGVLAAAVVVALSPRRLLWVRRAGAPPSAPALAAPGRPSDWVAASAAARRRMQRSAAWFAAMRAPARALPVIADRPAAGAPPDPDADALRLIVADTRRLWRALLAAARGRAVPALRAASAAPLFAADGRCIGVITRRRTLPARLVIRTIGLHPTPSLWIDAAAPPVPAVRLTPDPAAADGWTIRFPFDGTTYVTRPPSDPPPPALPGVTPLPGAGAGVAVARGLLTVQAFGSHGLSAIPDILDIVRTLLP